MRATGEQTVMEGLPHLAAAGRGSAPQLAHWAQLRAWEKRDLGHPPALASPLALIYHQYRHSRAPFFFFFYLMQQIIKKKGGRKKSFSNTC